MVSRNYSIDVLRLLLSFAVVVIHVHSGKWYDYVDPICRLAVPVFFIISGYFIYGEGINKKVKKGLAKVSKIAVWSTAIYALPFLPHLLNGDKINFSLMNFILFNSTPFGGHLWYLFAYIYTLTFVLLLNKSNLSKFIILIPTFFFVGLLFGRYSACLFNQDMPGFLSQNFLFVGFPFFFTGGILRKYLIIQRIHILSIILLLIITIAILYVESFFFHNENPSGINYIMVYPCSILLFLLFLKINIHVNAFFMYLSQASLYIYIFHPMVALLLQKVFSREMVGYSISKLSINPIFIFFLTWGGYLFIHHSVRYAINLSNSSCL